MTANFDALNAQRIHDAINTFSQNHLNTTYNSKISCFDSIDSTNAWLIENGKDGDFCLSETQTAGRGRRDNQWVSPNSGNIYLSYCCYFDNAIEHQSLLGLVAGIAIAEALQEIGLSGHGIKWPNDIFWNGKKLGGILIQTADNYQKFVIGIGLNISLPEESRSEITQAAVSLEDALKGKNFYRETVVINLIQRLLTHTEMFAQLPFQAFKQSWNRWDILHGQDVSFQHQNKEISGTVDGIDKHGRIGVLLESGIEYFSAADIKLKKPKHS
ncbi:MAG: BirA family biotin operon repressor/biotin-[acetyl-CoA-carboxylase] ligase [Cocleimonas sp.]|jgi:BirA family biotin operon repressor/biotin-[acetyl-CoA-carboxylase] ligase